MALDDLDIIRAALHSIYDPPFTDSTWPVIQET
jgi:hypothetical protein